MSVSRTCVCRQSGKVGYSFETGAERPVGQPMCDAPNNAQGPIHVVIVKNKRRKRGVSIRAQGTIATSGNAHCTHFEDVNNQRGKSWQQSLAWTPPQPQVTFRDTEIVHQCRLTPDQSTPSCQQTETILTTVYEDFAYGVPSTQPIDHGNLSFRIRLT